MARVRYGVSPWADPRGSARRPTYPRLTDSFDVPVVIVGGGLTGAATAYGLAAAGIRVVLIEAGRVASGGTSAATGLILADPCGSYLDHEAAIGRRAARHVWQSTRRAALDCSAAIRRLAIKCGLGSLDRILYARTAEEGKRLARELQGRRAAGLDATAVTARGLAALGIQGAGGVRTRGHARVDPVRLCHGLARAAAVRGAGIFESSPATKIAVTRHGIDVVTARGTLSAQTVVIATGEPTRQYRALARHFDRRESYAVVTPPLPAAIRSTLRDRAVALEDAADPPHRLHWPSDDRILWSGADQPRTPERTHAKTIVQRTGQLMYELSLTLEAISGLMPEHGWIVPYARAVDGLPFIGPHRNYPHHFFALGLGQNVANSFLASRVLLRHRAGEPARGDEAFGFARFAR
jgi:glycine/D-amino acid oxidase-like deaminating enzyme